MSFPIFDALALAWPSFDLVSLEVLGSLAQE